MVTKGKESWNNGSQNKESWTMVTKSKESWTNGNQGHAKFDQW